jgi:replication-associated recombination protein RarA
MTKAFPWPTVGGHDFYEVYSALQKSIRRSDEEEALYWAAELDLSDYGSHLWSRLRIIASEDVGLADPMATVQVHVLHENWKDAKGKKGDPERLFIVHAVVLLARAKKQRLVDHATCVAYNDRQPRRIPDHALDKHTTRGRALGRGVEHFLDEGAQLIARNEFDGDDPYAERAAAIWKAAERKAKQQASLL